MHEAARDDRVECIDGGRVARSGSGRAPERGNVGADAHPVHDADRLANRAAASEDEGVIAGAGANRLEAVAQGLAARETWIAAPAGRGGGVEKIEFQIREAEVAGKLGEQMAEGREKRRVGWGERVREWVVAGGPVRVVAGANRFAGLLVNDEPVGMIDHQARVAGGKKGRGPDAGFEAGGANFAGDFFESPRKLGVGRIPVAKRRLKAVVELNQVEWKLRAHRFERLDVGAERVLGDLVKVVVPGAPSALKRRADPRVHPSPGRVGPSRGQTRGGLIGGGDEQRIEFAMRARRESYIVEDRACDYFFRARHGEGRERSSGSDESGQDALPGR